MFSIEIKETASLSGTFLKLNRLSLDNFRCFDNFVLDVAGRSLSVISENGGGKTSVLSTVAMTLGRGGLPVLTDFRDLSRPIEITSVFTDFDLNEQAELTNAIDFTTPPQLQMSVLAVWDQTSEQVDAELTLPTKNRRPTRQERMALRFIYLPAWRDLTRLTSFDQRNSFLAEILGALPITQSLQAALGNIKNAIDALKSEPSLIDLFSKMRVFLSSVLPTVSGQGYDVGSTALTDKDLLSQLELLLSYASPFIAANRQSSGLAQLTVFALAAEIAANTPAALVCIDEPEVSLHPQAQRALCQALSALPNQTLIATHSSNLLQRTDPRQVVRLSKAAGIVTPISPSSISDAEAIALSRYLSSETAEGFFAKRIMFVEGPSDRLAMLALAKKKNLALDSLGVSIVTLDGAGILTWFVKLFGPSGFQLPLCGLCDSDHLSEWSKVLETSGVGTNLSQAKMETIGFFVCDRDLEDELIKTLGLAAVIQTIDQNGDTNAWKIFCQQPKNKNLTQADQLRAFLRKTQRKVLYAPLLVSKLSTTIPRPLEELLTFAIQ
jgi:putative ATP-dependent endonuclease of the OLD family